MTVTKRTRFEVLRRDRHTCRYCRSTTAELTVDHVIPVALGGNDDPSNLVAACRDCNAGKSSASLDDDAIADIAADALRWSEAMKAAVDRALAARDDGLNYLDEVDTEWLKWGIGEGTKRVVVERPHDWETTCLRWRELGMPVELVQDAVRIAMATTRVTAEKKWRYTCGVVWNKLTALQADALTELTEPADASTGQCVTEAPRWDLYVEGYRVARRDAQQYPTYLMAQLSAAVDGPDVWTGAPTLGRDLLDQARPAFSPSSGYSTGKTTSPTITASSPAATAS
jgi:hypothetical protein